MNKSVVLIVFVLLQCPHSWGQQPDSVTIPASVKYNNLSFVGVMFKGKNYRREWSTPVRMAVFDIKHYKGGFKIGELGGGMQTKSLTIKDNQGQEWALRTVDKDVGPVLKNKVLRFFFKRTLQDQISAAHPYASLVVGELAAALNLTAPYPEVFFVPDEPALQQYRNVFANKVCMLENRFSEVNGTKTRETEDVEQAVTSRDNYFIKQQELLKARLLDMLVGDWDRHAGQWNWYLKEDGNRHFYYPIARDRDFALFKSGSLTAKLARISFLPHLQGFTCYGKNLKKLNAKSHWFDRFFLSELDEKDWENIIRTFQAQITDSVIHRATLRIPREAYAISGATIERKLMNRRNGLLTNGMAYYRFIANTVLIAGTDEPEFFDITKQGDNLKVTVYNGEKKGGPIRYERIFNKKHTRLIRILGFGGNDHFEIGEDAATYIRMQIDGGKGDNLYNFKRTRKIRITDETQ